jgi:hypothetical protein
MAGPDWGTGSLSKAKTPAIFSAAARRQRVADYLNNLQRKSSEGLASVPLRFQASKTRMLLQNRDLSIKNSHCV